MPDNNFKVIVVGGGPVGLTAAHALHKAGIDFVVLERSNEIAVDVGASLVLAAGSLRVLHQLGLLDQLHDIGEELVFRKFFTKNGRMFKNDRSFFDRIKKKCGSRSYSFHRAELVQCLYDELPKEIKPNILTGKKVTDIQSIENQVKVFCDDGTMYEGDLVLGTDGVHSKTRQIMRKLALEANPNADWDPEVPYTSTYRCMWASFYIPPSQGMYSETQHKDRSAMYISGKGRACIFLYEKLPESTKERTSYTAEDVEAIGSRFAEYPITESLKVKDVLPNLVTSGMSDLQEGTCNNWGWGRIALAGDSIHKVCPNAGLGYQSGIQDVVSLVNKLKQLISSSESSEGPSVSALEAMYESYQSQRRSQVSLDASLSAFTTRAQAWANVWYYLLGRIVLVPIFMDRLLTKWLQVPIISSSLVFNFLDANEAFEGQAGWVHPLKNIY